MGARCKAFYEYHSVADGAVGRPRVDRVHRRPAIGAMLDRNGLRPSRYYVTKDDLVIMASRSACCDFRKVRSLRRVGSGRHDAVVDRGKGPAHYRRRAQVGAVEQLFLLAWLGAGSYSHRRRPRTRRRRLICRGRSSRCSGTARRKIAADLTTPMVWTGEGAVGSMGDDTPFRRSRTSRGCCTPISSSASPR